MRRVLRWWREWRSAREEYGSSVEEMRFHIEQETEHNIRNGMRRGEARRAALRAFGGIDRYAEVARDQRPGTAWTEFRMSYLDWKLGGRMLVRNPGVSIIGGLTLAAAIGVGAGWFEMTLMMVRPTLPLPDGDRIVRMEYWDPVAGAVERRTVHELEHWSAGLNTVEAVGGYRTVQRNLVVPGISPQSVAVAEISAVAFDVARVPPLLGRPLIRADEDAGGDDVVVIGFDAWHQHFAGDHAIIGREVQLGRARATVVGVMPEGFRFPSHHQYWSPLRRAHSAPLEGSEITVFGRLRPGATLMHASAELETWAAGMAAAAPATHALLRPQVLPFAAPANAAVQREVFLINLVAWLLLAAACANVAALMFARTALREDEIVVRNALGASRARVMGQLFTESLVLTTTAALLGLLAAHLVIGWVIDQATQRGAPVPFWWEAGIEPVTVLYTALLAVAGAAMIGLLPAIRATGPRLRARLAQVGSGGTSLSFGGAWSLIIMLQVAFSVLGLGFGSAAGYEAFQHVQARAAFDADAILTFQPRLEPDDAIVMGTAVDTTAGQSAAALAELSRLISSEPGVAAVAVTRTLPGAHHPSRRLEAQRGSDPVFVIDTGADGGGVHIGGVGPGFFGALGVPVVAGREFLDGDVHAAGSVVVINEALARHLGGNPVGMRVRIAAFGDGEPGPWQEVVGVAGNVGLSPTRRGEAEYLYGLAPATDGAHMVVRMSGPMSDFPARLHSLALRADPSLHVRDLLPLREVIRRQDQGIVHGALVGLGAVLLAVALSAASLHALVSVQVALRTREIGIRRAIGATPFTVLASLFRRAATQLGVGVLAGNAAIALLLALMVDNVQPSLLIIPAATASVVMLVVGLASCLLPARRALKVQPTEALKAAR